MAALAFVLVVTCSDAPVLASPTPNPIYSGRTTWSIDRATVTFDTPGAMPDTKEGFFWNVPAEVKNIVISGNVTVQGGFRIGLREPGNPLFIVGKDRKTSVIYGTETEAWTTKNGISNSEKWKYGSVSVLGDAVVHVSNLTAQNPRGYNISGYAPRSVLHVANCDLIDTRKGDKNNSDGFVGANGSSIYDSVISTSDDGIKVYHDITIVNVRIEQRRNGAPIQFGWGGEDGNATACITNLAIVGVNPEGLYNMAPFTWEGGTQGIRKVNIDGLSVNLRGKIFNKEQARWEPAALFRLKPSGCTLHMDITRAELGGMTYGTRSTKSRININGHRLP